MKCGSFLGMPDQPLHSKNGLVSIAWTPGTRGNALLTPTVLT